MNTYPHKKQARKQKRGDEQIDTRNFSLLVDYANSSGRISFDPYDFEVLHNADGGQLVRLVPQSSTPAAAEVCQLQVVPTDGSPGFFDVLPGRGWTQLAGEFWYVGFNYEASVDGEYYVFWDRLYSGSGANPIDISTEYKQGPRYVTIARIVVSGGTVSEVEQIRCGPIGPPDETEVWPFKVFTSDHSGNKVADSIRVIPGFVISQLTLKSGSTYADIPVIDSADDMTGGGGGPLSFPGGPAFALPTVAGRYALVAEAQISPDSSPAIPYNQTYDLCDCALLSTIRLHLMLASSIPSDVPWACPVADDPDETGDQSIAAADAQRTSIFWSSILIQQRPAICSHFQTTQTTSS